MKVEQGLHPRLESRGTHAARAWSMKGSCASLVWRFAAATVVSLGLAGCVYVSVERQGSQVDAEEEAARVARVGGSVPVETDFIAGARTFEPGNRTYWHTHAGGFILFVQEGRARTQRRGEPMRELGPGEIDYTPPGVEHWHGSAPDAPLLQLGVIPFGGGIEFLEPVTDAEYNGE